MPPRHCSAIARQIAQALDREMQQARELQTTQRYGRDNDGGNWRTPGGLLEHQIGPEFPPLAKREFLSTLGYVNNSGPSGAKLATLAERYTNLVDINKGLEYKQQLERFTKGLKPEESLNALSVLDEMRLDVDANGMYVYSPGSDKTIKPMNQRVAQAVNAVRSYRQMAEARAAGEIKGYVPQSQMPEMYETRRLRDKDFHQQTVEGLAQRNARKNGRSVASQDDYTIGQQLYEHYAGDQYTHVGSNVRRGEYIGRGDGRITDLDAMMQLYVSQHQRMLQEQRIFGPRESLREYPKAIGQLLKGINEENPGSNFAQVASDALVKDTFGMQPHDPVFHGAFVRSLQNMQTLKLTFSTLKHGSRAFNALLKTDLTSVGGALKALLSNSEDVFGMPTREAAGSFASVVSNTIYESTLFQPEGVIGRFGERILQYNGFTPVDRAARMLTGTSGAMFAQAQARKLVEGGGKRAERALIELGISPERVRASHGILSLEDKMIAGQKLINASDGRGRAMDLPFFTSQWPSMWRALLTFRTFPLNQVRLMWDMWYQNPARFLGFGLAVMPAMGMLLRGFESFVLEDTLGIPKPKFRQNEDGIAQYLESAVMGTSFGYISELASAIYMSGTTAFGHRSFFEPPIMSTMDDFLMMAGHAVRGNTKELQFDVERQFGGLGAAWVRMTR